MAYVYVLYNKDYNRHYIGSTRDLDARIKAHRSGKVRSTKAYRPWDLVYQEKFDDYSEARKRELFLKSGVGRKWISENIQSK